MQYKTSKLSLSLKSHQCYHSFRSFAQQVRFHTYHRRSSLAAAPMVGLRPPTLRFAMHHDNGYSSTQSLGTGVPHTHRHCFTRRNMPSLSNSLSLSLSLCLSLYLPPLLRTTLLRAPCFDEPKFCWQDYTSLKAGSLFCTRIRCRIICHSSSPLIRCACESQWLREDLLAQNVHKKSSTHSADPSHGSADRMSPKSMLQGTSAKQGSGTSALIQQETWLAVLSSGPIKTAESITVRFPQI